MCICVYLCVLCLFSLYLSLSLYLSSTDATTIWGWERLLPIVPPCKSRLWRIVKMLIGRIIKIPISLPFGHMCQQQCTHTHTPRLSVCNHYNATVSSAHKVDRKNRSISTSSHRCWSITLKSYTMREPCQTMIIADFVFAMGLTKNLLLATFLKCFVLTNIFAHIVENGYTVSCDKRTFVNWTHGNVKTNGRGKNMSNTIFWIFSFG